MDSLLVYADFDWLPEPTLIGRLTYESIRGSDSYGFSFDEGWLRDFSDLFLTADLNQYPGIQYTKEDRDIFGCFADALPDRWGRMLFARKEQITAREEQRGVRRLSSFDYLKGVDDLSRMGALRFKQTSDGDFINSDSSLRIPPITDIRTLEAASMQVEESEETDKLPDKRWINQLLQPGTSIGGARPKANVIDADGVLHIAKFPSRNDEYDAGLWEHFCHLLGRQAGVNTADTSVMGSASKYHTLLSRRFDREKGGKRIHFASAMTLLGLQDGDNASNGYGYLDIVDFIIQHCTDVQTNLKELFRRVAYNICVGNSDDHFRNHGFLLTQKGWILSPAYDINPTLNNYQSLLITPDTSEARLDYLYDACEYYFIEQEVAQSIINEVTTAVSNWRQLGTRLNISSKEMQYFAGRLDKNSDRPGTESEGK